MVHLTLSNYQSRTHFLFYITHFMVIHSYIILILQLRDTITELYVALQAVFQQLLHTEDISVRYCGYYRDFLERELLQTKGSKQFKLKSSLRKFYGRHHDLAIVTEYPCHK